jgi:uncharacterized protein (TIGR02147 family)
VSRRAAVDVFSFRDYRQFLRAYYAAGKAGGQAVTLRAFSKRAGLRSPNYLKLVMDGTRNLTQPMAARFAEASGLRAEAAEYFCELVAFNQAKTTVDRGRAYERLRRFPRYRKVYKLDAAQESYHSSWYLPALRELVAHKDFKDDPRWIAKQLLPAIAPREAERALATLFELGLVERDANGRVVQRDPLVTTPEGPLGHHVVTYHRSMLERAAAALDEIPRGEREIAALTLCLSSAQIVELKQRLERFREELLQLYTAGPDASRIVQVNLQMFPLSVKET